MAKGRIEVSRVSIAQPDVATTTKSQKRGPQPAEYKAEAINQELDYVHERINKITVELGPYADLDPAASLAETIATVNSLLSALREAGIVKS